jgi:hypothetical protein
MCYHSTHYMKDRHKPWGLAIPMDDGFVRQLTAKMLLRTCVMIISLGVLLPFAEII